MWNLCLTSFRAGGKSLNIFASSLRAVQAYFRVFTVTWPTTVTVCCLLRTVPIRDMFVDKTIQRERSRALDYHYQGQCDRQQMVLNPVTFLASEPVQKEAESEMNSCNSTHHGERDD